MAMPDSPHSESLLTSHEHPSEQDGDRRLGTSHLATMNLLLEHLSDGVILVEDDGRIADLNDVVEQIFGEPIPVGAHIVLLAQRYAIASTDGAPLPPDRLPLLSPLTGETVRDAEIGIVRPDGKRRYLSITASPVVVRGGLQGGLIIVSDITARVRREREAAAFRTLSQQLAGSELDLDAVYGTVVTRLAEITGARAVRLTRLEPSMKRLRLAHGTGTPLASNGIDLQSVEIEAVAARTRLPAVVPDFGAIEGTHAPGNDELGGAPASGSAIAVPLIVRSELIGTLSYELASPHVFDDGEIAFLDMIAAQSAMAINNATLFRQRTRERSLLANIIDRLPAGLIVFEVIPVSGRRADYRVSMLNALAVDYLPAALLARVADRRGGIVGARLRRLSGDEDTARLLRWLDDALARGEVVLGEEVGFDRTGSDVSPTHYWNGAIVPLRDETGETSELVLLATNITEQVATRNRVEELVRVAGMRAAELEAMVSAMTDAVTVCDADGELRLANRAALETYGVDSLGELLTMEDARSRIVLRRTDGTAVEPENRPLTRALAGETWQEDYTLFHHGLGRDIFRRTSAAPVRDSDDEIIGAVAVETDITSLIEIDRLKDEFFSMAAHELRTPLTAIKGYVQILSRQLANAPDPIVPKALATVRDQGNRMERLINELLDVARIESRQLDFRYRETDIIELIEQITGEVQRSTPRHTLQLHHGGNAIIGHWDRDRLAQVLDNLLSNAVKYSPDGGTIEVAIERAELTDGQEVTIRIADQGLGIPAEQIPRLFARFARVRDGRHFQQSGLGLGLYITKEIIDSHGGTIDVHSALGEGTTFVITLPLQPTPRSTVQRGEPPAVGGVS